MLRVDNMPISASDVRTLADLLGRVGRADDVTAAENLMVAILEGAPTVELSSAELHAIRSVLADAPEQLRELRDSLARHARET
jgi:hypothetical protein